MEWTGRWKLEFQQSVAPTFPLLREKLPDSSSILPSLVLVEKKRKRGGDDRGTAKGRRRLASSSWPSFQHERKDFRDEDSVSFLLHRSSFLPRLDSTHHRTRLQAKTSGEKPLKRCRTRIPFFPLSAFSFRTCVNRDDTFLPPISSNLQTEAEKIGFRRGIGFSFLSSVAEVIFRSNPFRSSRLEPRRIVNLVAYRVCGEREKLGNVGNWRISSEARRNGSRFCRRGIFRRVELSRGVLWEIADKFFGIRSNVGGGEAIIDDHPRRE